MIKKPTLWDSTVPSTELGMSWKLGWCLSYSDASPVSELLVFHFPLLLVLLIQYLFSTVVLVILNY